MVVWLVFWLVVWSVGWLVGLYDFWLATLRAVRQLLFFPEIRGCFSLQVVHFVGACTNWNFVTKCSLARLKPTIDDVISTETEK